MEINLESLFYFLNKNEKNIFDFLNTSAILRQKISSYPNLKAASKDALNEYELIAGGTGIHWTSLNEDLSLKVFLRDELRNMVKGTNDFIAA